MKPAPQPDRSAILANIRDRIATLAASCMSKEDAEDIAQAVVVALMTTYAGKSDPAELLRLAFKIYTYMKYRKWDEMARRKNMLSVDDPGIASKTGTPEDLRLLKDFTEKLAAAIEKMGEPCFTIVRMLYTGFSIADIRKEINRRRIIPMSKNAVTVRISRCRKHLAEILGRAPKGAPQKAI
jgi:DNA-directed RNA polymerase specialized sigma24 family protein